jgi:hypothetical protein
VSHIRKPRVRFTARDLFYAWLTSTLFGGAPSTIYALLTDADPLEATRAAGAMLVPLNSPPLRLFAAAVLVHSAVSAFWTLLFAFMLPRRRIALWAVVGSAGVAFLDLMIIAPLFFPSVAALAFWPQFADHLMWGACLGLTLYLRHCRSRHEGHDLVP